MLKIHGMSEMDRDSESGGLEGTALLYTYFREQRYENGVGIFLIFLDSNKLRTPKWLKNGKVL